jgi:hypothetical protein
MPTRRRKRRGYRVFISHSTKDKWIARQMARRIEAAGRKHGIQTFLDEKDLAGGESISRTIQANLRSCHEFVVLLTRDSVSRPWVLIEIGGALALKKHLVPIVNHLRPAEMPDAIADCLAVDLNDFDTYLQQLVNRARNKKDI